MANGMRINATVFQVDFEMAIHQALRSVFPAARIRGCAFHYSQCVWRKVQELGMVTVFRSQPEVRDTVLLFCALPLIPFNLIDEVWIQIMSDVPSICAALCDYMTETWIEDVAPRFSRALWSHDGNDGPRTTNHLEGWHSALNKAIGRPHPQLFALIEFLQSEQAVNEGIMRLLRAGHPAKAPKKKYLEKERKLKVYKEQLLRGEKTSIQFLRSASHLLKLS